MCSNFSKLLIFYLCMGKPKFVTDSDIILDFHFGYFSVDGCLQFFVSCMCRGYSHNTIQ